MTSVALAPSSTATTKTVPLTAVNTAAKSSTRVCPTRSMTRPITGAAAPTLSPEAAVTIPTTA